VSEVHRTMNPQITTIAETRLDAAMQAAYQREGALRDENAKLREENAHLKASVAVLQQENTNLLLRLQEGFKR
jgi:cell division protein FtsB